jgi:hypothetical protein
MDQKSERIVARAKIRLYLAKALLLEKAAALATAAHPLREGPPHAACILAGFDYG